MALIVNCNATMVKGTFVGGLIVSCIAGLLNCFVVEWPIADCWWVYC
jgi:hypothetical protein